MTLLLGNDIDAKYAFVFAQSDRPWIIDPHQIGNWADHWETLRHHLQHNWRKSSPPVVVIDHMEALDPLQQATLRAMMEDNHLVRWISIGHEHNNWMDALRSRFSELHEFTLR